MDALKLKSDLHKLVDEIHNVQLLQVIYDFLKSGRSASGGSMWTELTKSEQQEVLTAFQESEKEYNLIKGKDAFKKS